MTCFGLLVIFFCGTQQPVTVNSFCQVAGPDIVRLRTMTPTEVAALSRSRKDAIITLRRNYTKLCETKGGNSG